MSALPPEMPKLARGAPKLARGAPNHARGMPKLAPARLRLPSGTPAHARGMSRAPFDMSRRSAAMSRPRLGISKPSNRIGVAKPAGVAPKRPTDCPGANVSDADIGRYRASCRGRGAGLRAITLREAPDQGSGFVILALVIRVSACPHAALHSPACCGGLHESRGGCCLCSAL